MFVIGFLAAMTLFFALGIISANRKKRPTRGWVVSTICWAGLLGLALWHVYYDTGALTRMPSMPKSCYFKPTVLGDRLICSPRFKP